MHHGHTWNSIQKNRLCRQLGNRCPFKSNKTEKFSSYLRNRITNRKFNLLFDDERINHKRFLRSLGGVTLNRSLTFKVLLTKTPVKRGSHWQDQSFSERSHAYYNWYVIIHSNFLAPVWTFTRELPSKRNTTGSWRNPLSQLMVILQNLK